MQQLNLPKFSFKVKNIDGEKKQIFDTIRKKYIVLQPEEWVRQNFAQYLIHYKNYPKSLMVFEYSLKYNKLSKRGDIVVFGKNGKPKLLIECKAPHIKLTQKTFDQAAQYNLVLKLDYLIITNGLDHFCCKINHQDATYSFLKHLPEYSEIS